MRSSLPCFSSFYINLSNSQDIYDYTLVFFSCCLSPSNSSFNSLQSTKFSSYHISDEIPSIMSDQSNLSTYFLHLHLHLHVCIYVFIFWMQKSEVKHLLVIGSYPLDAFVSDQGFLLDSIIG